MKIDVSVVDGFLEEIGSVVKENSKCENCKPLCSASFSEGEQAVSFSLEMRGFENEEQAFFLVGRISGNEEVFISRGFFTAGGHHASFSRSHGERGMNIQQGVLIEMKGILQRMLAEFSHCFEPDKAKIAFVQDLLNELQCLKVKVAVVRTDDEPSLGLHDGDESIDTLSVKGMKPEEEAKERYQKSLNQEPVEDIVGESFAKAVGNKSENPEKDNILDDDMKSMKEYVVKKEPFLKRMWNGIRHRFGFYSDSEHLESLFDHDLNGRQNETGEEVK